jgi:NADH:ubiquinone oxidoreductase subunit
MNENLTTIQSFKAMQKFLEGYYKKTNSDDIGSLLGDLQLTNTERKTMDPAAWENWLKAIIDVARENNAKQ